MPANKPPTEIKAQRISSNLNVEKACWDRAERKSLAGDSLDFGSVHKKNCLFLLSASMGFNLVPLNFSNILTIV